MVNFPSEQGLHAGTLEELEGWVESRRSKADPCSDSDRSSELAINFFILSCMMNQEYDIWLVGLN